MSDDFQRARSQEAKRQRERAILDAGRALATKEGTRSVTLTAIAEAIGLHKSALLRYFETREQIFLQLTVEGWQEWAAGVIPALDGLRAPGPESVAKTLASSLVARPLFCDLLAEAPLNLERNVSVDGVREFKVAVLAEVDRTTETIARVTGLSYSDAGDVLAASTSLTGALWQMANPNPDIAALYRSDPRLGHAVVKVEPRVAHMLTGMIRGLLADSSCRSL